MFRGVRPIQKARSTDKGTFYAPPALEHKLVERLLLPYEHQVLADSQLLVLKKRVTREGRRKLAFISTRSCHLVAEI